MICGYCGGRIVGNKCLKPNCKAQRREYWEKRVEKKIDEYQPQVDKLWSYETSTLKLEDYKELKKIEKETKEWEKELEDGLTFLEVKQFQRKITDLENTFPERIRLKYKNKDEYCSHRNIHWDGCFKSEEEKWKEQPYCLDCGEDKNKNFTRKFQNWYYQEIEGWLKENAKPKGLEFERFLRKKTRNYDELYHQELPRGEIVDDINDEWITFCEFSGYIENHCLEFAEEQKNKDPNKNPNRERESKFKVED